MIEGSMGKTENDTQIAQQTSTVRNEIVGSITKVTDVVAEITASSNEQAQGIAQINQKLGPSSAEHRNGGRVCCCSGRDEQSGGADEADAQSL